MESVDLPLDEASASPGIDHPLVAVNDLPSVRQAYTSLGFQLSPTGQHPWGTATSLILFKKQILELVGIGDASLLDGYGVTDFKFGRHVDTYLKRREGVALTALYSNDALATEANLVARGVVCAGTIEFGRDVIRPDGEADRTRTTLKVFPNKIAPRLSVFACQQHRRDLLEFPELMQHPNSVFGISAVTVFCSQKDWDSTLNWYSRLQGCDAINTHDGEAIVHTGNGHWRICNSQALERRFGFCTPDKWQAVSPMIVGIDFRVKNLQTVAPYVANRSEEIDGALVLKDANLLGGVMLRFCVHVT